MFERDGWSEVCGWVVGEEEEKKKAGGVVWLVLGTAVFLVQSQAK